LTTLPERTLEARIRDAVVRALRIDTADAAMPLEMGSTPGWDSLGHMAVVMEVETEFQTQFPSYRLPELLNVASIAHALRETQV
jgi:acyl carrier protein